MIKNKALLIVTILVLALSVVAMSCAPAAKPATTPPATTTPPAATTPPASTTTPPSPPGGPVPPSSSTPAEVKTSFEAATFTSDKYGLTLKYPKSWITKEATGDSILIAAANSEATADNLVIMVVPAAADISKAAKDNLDSSATFKQYSAKADIKSSKTGTLADGKTACTKTELTATIVIYNVYSYCVGVTKGDKTILAYASTLGTKTELVQEIANTLTLK